MELLHKLNKDNYGKDYSSTNKWVNDKGQIFVYLETFISNIL